MPKLKASLKYFFQIFWYLLKPFVIESPIIMNGVAEFFKRAHIFYEIEHTLKFIITTCTLLLYTHCIYGPDAYRLF